MHDVIIIGAGPVGLACAISCKRAGLSVLVVDKGALVNSLVGYPTGMEFFSTPDLLEIGGHPFPTRRYKPVREEALDYYRKVASAEGIALALFEQAIRLDGAKGNFALVTNRAVRRASNVIVATGFFDKPNLLDVPGEDLPHVSHYFKEPYAFASQRVSVVGAKNSAAKAALLCYRHGADVTLIVRGPELSGSIKYWIRPDLENRIREGSIRAIFESRVREITPEEVHVETPDGNQRIGCDWVLALTGYQPDYELLAAFGIETEVDQAKTPKYEPESHQTSRPGVYIAGTICGGLATSRWFIENGRFHAKVIAKHISEQARP